MVQEPLDSVSRQPCINSSINQNLDVGTEILCNHDIPLESAVCLAPSTVQYVLRTYRTLIQSSRPNPLKQAPSLGRVKGTKAAKSSLPEDSLHYTTYTHYSVQLHEQPVHDLPSFMGSMVECVKSILAMMGDLAEDM